MSHVNRKKHVGGSPRVKFAKARAPKIRTKKARSVARKVRLGQMHPVFVKAISRIKARKIKAKRV